MIETFGLCKRFGEKCAVDHLTLAAQPGEVTGFLGPNGSGKTTTIRLLMGLLRPSEGRANILGRDCQTDGTALKHDVGYLPEEPFLYPYLTGRELLEFVAGLHGFARAEARRRASLALERFGLTAEQDGFSIRDLVRYLAGQGRTVFLSTHLLDAADKICHRVAIIKAGVLRALGTPAELRAQQGCAADASLEDVFLTLTTADR